MRVIAALIAGSLLGLPNVTWAGLSGCNYFSSDTVKIQPGPTKKSLKRGRNEEKLENEINFFLQQLKHIKKEMKEWILKFNSLAVRFNAIVTSGFLDSDGSAWLRPVRLKKMPQVLNEAYVVAAYTNEILKTLWDLTDEVSLAMEIERHDYRKLSARYRKLLHSGKLYAYAVGTLATDASFAMMNSKRGRHHMLVFFMDSGGDLPAIPLGVFYFDNHALRNSFRSSIERALERDTLYGLPKRVIDGLPKRVIENLPRGVIDTLPKTLQIDMPNGWKDMASSPAVRDYFDNRSIAAEAMSLSYRK